MTRFFKEPIYVTRPLLPEIDKIDKRINIVWESKWLTNFGDQHNELEQRLKEYLKTENLVLFNNGTLALMLGIKALGLTGEVITTPFTFPATVQALDWTGLSPVFCDIEKDTLNIDPDKIEYLITERTTAILAVHVFGNPCNVNKIQNIADKYNLKVIYDGAHIFGSLLYDMPISSYGDMTMFSFHATKLFHSVEGGGLVFKDSLLEKKLNLLKNFGINGPEQVLLSGINAKMNEVQAAIGIEVLNIVDEERERRRIIKKTYEKELANIDGIRVITTLDEVNSSYQYLTIEINEEKFGASRDYVHEEFKKYNVFTRKYFSPLCSDFEWYKDLESAQKENLPQAHKSVNQVLSLPYYGELEITSVEMICAILKDVSCALKKLQLRVQKG